MQKRNASLSIKFFQSVYTIEARSLAMLLGQLNLQEIIIILYKIDYIILLFTFYRD